MKEKILLLEKLYEDVNTENIKLKRELARTRAECKRKQEKIDKAVYQLNHLLLTISSEIY